ncbi:hypothetical protein HDV00_009484 [Rhizophlyctis rosea]|nr:hypothetical protein HDV00_009484 [Rhizophlyctis rosea]
MGAPARPLRKYSDHYISIYPQARILLCISRYSDFLTSSTTTLKSYLEPVIALLKGADPDGIFVHIFSNGGAYTFTLLAQLYLSTTGTRIPTPRIILDSSPSTIGEITPSATAFAYSLPKHPLIYYPGYAAIYLLVICIAGYSLITGAKVSIQVAYEGLNDESLVPLKNARRCYIYSKEDELVNFRHVEKHAEWAESEGCVVRTEKFEGTKHVAHVVGDWGRYWGVVGEFWGGK